jgi:CDP-glucose 4,6-dehydratase
MLRALESTGADIHLLDVARPKRFCGTYHSIDLRNAGEVGNVFREVGPEVIVHLAGQPGVAAAQDDPVGSYQLNVLATANVLEAARQAKAVRAVVVVSSNHVYGAQAEMPTTESAPLNGEGVYATTKVCADVLARCYGKTYGVPVGIARITNSFGGDDPHSEHIVTQTIRAVMRGQRPVIQRSGRDTKGFLYVEDTVHGLLVLAEKTANVAAIRGEAFNLVPARPTSVAELVCKILEVMGAVHLNAVVSNPEAGADREHLSGQKAADVLGWMPRYSLEAGLRKTVDWYLKEADSS